METHKPKIISDLNVLNADIEDQIFWERVRNLGIVVIGLVVAWLVCRGARRV